MAAILISCAGHRPRITNQPVGPSSVAQDASLDTETTPDATALSRAALPAWARGASLWTPLRYGGARVIDSDATRTLLVAGNVRVRVDASGAVTVGEQLTSAAIDVAVQNGERWTFSTGHGQALIASDFTGRFTKTVDMPDQIFALASGDHAAARSEDGRWWDVEGPQVRELTALGHDTFALHFRGAREMFALRTPGDVLRGEQGATLTRAALPEDVALDLFSSRGANAEPELEGARRSYRWQRDAWVEAPASAEPESVTEPRVARAKAAWEQWWRAHLWPERRALALSHGRDAVVAIEHRGALYWTDKSKLHWLRRDGARGEHPLPDVGSCFVAHFGARLLAACKTPGVDGEHYDHYYAFDPEARALTNLTPDPLPRAAPMIAPDGSAIVVALTRPVTSVTTPHPHLVWTPARSWRRASLPAPLPAYVLANGKLLAAFDRALSSFDLDAETITQRPVQRMQRDRPTPARSPGAMQMDAQGRVAVTLRLFEQNETCGLYRGTLDAPLERVEVPQCAEVRWVHMADPTFGVVVYNDDSVRVTRDGGGRWEALPSDGAEAVEDRTSNDRSVTQRRGDNEIAIGPHRVVQRDVLEVDEREWIAREQPMARYELPERDEFWERSEIPCSPAFSRRTLNRPRATESTRAWPMLGHRGRVEVTLTRADAGVTLALAWTHDDGGRGRFNGAAPWPEAQLDFRANNQIGYALRGASPAGALIERCVHRDDDGLHIEPTRCDAYWFDRGGRAIALDLQRTVPGAGGARIELAVADGLGWVIQLAPGSGNTGPAWSQWQHWSPQATLTRWGDLRVFDAPNVYGALARINGAWGTVVGFRDAVAHPRRWYSHGGGAPIEMPSPRAALFCTRRPAPQTDRWWHSGGVPESSAVVTNPNETETVYVQPELVLARDGDGWCVERSHSVWAASEMIFPSSGEFAHSFWWRDAPRPAGSGRTGWADSDFEGYAQSSPVRCQRPSGREGCVDCD